MDRRPFPRLAGTSEVGGILGVTRQRAAQLWKDRKDFPRPVAVLKCGPIWLESDILEYAKIPRPAGRQPKKKDEKETDKT